MQCWDSGPRSVRQVKLAYARWAEECWERLFWSWDLNNMAYSCGVPKNRVMLIKPDKVSDPWVLHGCAKIPGGSCIFCEWWPRDFLCPGLWYRWAISKHEAFSKMPLAGWNEMWFENLCKIFSCCAPFSWVKWSPFCSGLGFNTLAVISVRGADLGRKEHYIETSFPLLVVFGLGAQKWFFSSFFNCTSLANVMCLLKPFFIVSFFEGEIDGVSERMGGRILALFRPRRSL